MKLTINLEKIGKKITKQWLAVAVSFVLVLPGAGVLGMTNGPAMYDPEIDQDLKKVIGETKALVLESSPKGEDAEETALKGTNTEGTNSEGINPEEAALADTENTDAENADSLQAKYENLPEDEKQLLEDLRISVEAKNMTQTAKLLDKKQEVLAELFYGVFEGQRFLYDGNSVSEDIDGEGLVLTMPEIIFYGSFENGHPQGRCLALQFINVDSPRYNYSDGIWDQGKMNGPGTTGYCYYENIPQGENAWATKTGQFVDDQLEGTITYEIKGSDDSLSHWDMIISQGKIQLDNRWTHLDDRGEYQLMSSDSVSHAYIIADDQLDQLLWMNLLGWE